MTEDTSMRIVHHSCAIDFQGEPAAGLSKPYTTVLSGTILVCGLLVVAGLFVGDVEPLAFLAPTVSFTFVAAVLAFETREGFLEQTAQGSDLLLSKKVLLSVLAALVFLAASVSLAVS
ncbi:hypothetical protein FIV42_15655 [Persicimonas caeni]|uniref:Uncharacterized protein n=1 Tax=Persicimonas caeni TaxID=2292766 RepID=A0A4Y6PWK4_PERCE|nr:hypothetical protein [Persicimonas caeni]QDG52125.1 hypothetical protein FIV42_15655 [Persicimonas caeni]QED33347.1 hypothetical protein FRD00_15650 [Persicimonas caeni]